jgi:hypothetical protein
MNELCGGGVLRGEQGGRLRVALGIQQVREHVEGVARWLWWTWKDMRDRRSEAAEGKPWRRERGSRQGKQAQALAQKLER